MSDKAKDRVILILGVTGLLTEVGMLLVVLYTILYGGR